MVIVMVSVFAAGISNAVYFQGLLGSLRNSAGSSGYSSVVKYSLPSYVANAAQFLSYRVDVFLVNWFWGATAVGLYVLAVNIAELVWLLPSAAATALFPKVAATQTKYRENAELASRACRFALWLSLSAAIILGVSGYLALPFVYGEAFRESRIPLLLLLPGVVGFSVVTVLAAYIAGMGRPQTNMLVSLVGALITITGDLLLIPRYGIAGAALVSSVSYLLSALLMAVIFIWRTRVSPSSIIVLSQEDITLARGWMRHDAVKQARCLLGIGN
jgi:O-antigen/teichoic acid export membrane protein